jgi:AcrR family transcriptional regulator
VTERAYHHGDLRRALLDVAAELVAETGPTEWSLREIARRAGVSHAAPAHHFGDKAGLLRALATEGFELLATAFAEADADTEGRPAIDRHVAQGVAYLEFSGGHPGHYDVMFRADLFEPDDAYAAVATEAYQWLVTSSVRLVDERGDGDADDLAVASWALAHGLTGLLAEGFVDDRGDRRALATRVLGLCLAAAPEPTARGRRRVATVRP